MAEAQLWARTGVLAAFALVLSYLETFIPLPMPIPGAKLGLANIPILMALAMLDGKSALAIALIKTLVSGLLFASPIMIPYSAAGTLLALVVMWLLVRVPGLHTVMVSVVGSLFHVAGQLAVATLLLGTPLVWLTFPLLLVIACFTGAATGWCAQRLMESLEAAGILDGGPVERALYHAEAGAPAFPGRASAYVAPAGSLLARWAARVDARALIALFSCYIIATLCATGPVALGVCTAIALAVAATAGVTVRDALKALVPLLSILTVATIAQVLYQQQGTVVAQLGPLAITDHALIAAALMLLRLICIMAASIAFARAVPFKRISDALLALMAPLGRFGVHVEALALSLDVALQFIPVLAADFEHLRTRAAESDPSLSSGSLPARLRAHLKLMSPLAVQAFAYADGLAVQLAHTESDPAARRAEDLDLATATSAVIG